MTGDNEKTIDANHIHLSIDVLSKMALDLRTSKKTAISGMISQDCLEANKDAR